MTLAPAYHSHSRRVEPSYMKTDCTETLALKRFLASHGPLFVPGSHYAAAAAAYAVLHINHGLWCRQSGSRTTRPSTGI
jgi:hypothetical protein